MAKRSELVEALKQATEREEYLQQRVRMLASALGERERAIQNLQTKVSESGKFKVGDFVEHHLIGRVTKIESWGVEVECSDMAKANPDPIVWSIEHNEPDWHVI
jgi:hypothetical protein